MSPQESSQLTKAAVIEDRSTGEFYERYEFVRVNGSNGSLEVRRADAADRKKFRSILLNAGAALSVDPQLALATVERAAAEDAREHIVFAAKTGWLQNAEAFVMRDRLIGVSEDPIVGICPRHAGDPRGRTSVSGDCASWAESVGEIALGSSSLLTLISCAFAAPLMSMLGEATFGIVMTAPSRFGKTAVELAAASVVGLGRREDLLSWNMTKAHLEERLPEYNDMIMLIDDLETIQGRDRYARIRSIAYEMAAGHAKGRSALFEPNPKRGSWNTILITSGEHDVKSVASKAQEVRNLGEMIRLIDLPLTNSAGHIFDRAEHLNNADWVSAEFQKLLKACEDNHGAVFDEFVAGMIADKNAALSYLIRRRDHFLAKAASQDAGPIARDIARKFGLMYAAGRLAAKMQLVPWPRGRIRSAVLRMYRAAAMELPLEGKALVSDGRKRLRDALEQLPRKKGVEDFANCDGYLTRNQNRVRATITRDAFAKVFRSKEQQDATLRWLLAKEKIETAAGTSKPREQFEWPHGRRRRSYRIDL